MSEPGFTIVVVASDMEVLREKAKELGKAIDGDDMRLVMGAALKEAVRAHFYALSSDNDHHKTADRLGAQRMNLYMKAGDNTHDPELESDGVSVSVDDPEHALMQRIFGGPISGKPFLTIPATAEAYGRRAREFDNLRLILFPSGAGALVEKGQKWVSGQTPVFYWLVREVVQNPDPTVAPDPDEVMDSVERETSDYLERLLERV